MANLCEVTDEILDEFEKWLESEDMTDGIKAIARKYPPWKLFRMKDTGQRVTTLAFGDDGTIRVVVSGQFNFIMFERQVFGVNPDDLEECDLPSPDERLGVVLKTDREIESYLEDIKQGKSQDEILFPRVAKSLYETYKEMLERN